MRDYLLSPGLCQERLKVERAGQTVSNFLQGIGWRLPSESQQFDVIPVHIIRLSGQLDMDMNSQCHESIMRVSLVIRECVAHGDRTTE